MPPAVILVTSEVSWWAEYGGGSAGQRKAAPVHQLNLRALRLHAIFFFV